MINDIVLECLVIVKDFIASQKSDFKYLYLITPNLIYVNERVWNEGVIKPVHYL